MSNKETIKKIEKIIETKKQGKTWSELAKIFNYKNAESIRKTTTKLATKYRLKIENDKKQLSFSDDEKSATAIAIRKNKPYTEKELIKLFDVDTKKWIPGKLEVNFWDVTTKKGDTYRNYQSKIIFKPKNITFDYMEARDEFIKSVKKHKPIYKKINYKFNKKNGRNIMVVSIADLHLSQLCWHRETGFNYDTKIGYNNFLFILKELVRKSSIYNLEKIIFVVGNDFFNTDNRFDTTSFGTQQKNDLRWQKTYKIGRELLIKAIDFLRLYAPVKTIIISGNHDKERMFYVGDCLEQWYSVCKEVEIDNTPRIRKFHVYGKNLFGFTHGDKIKIQKFPILMAQSEPIAWGKTKFREWFLGHLHHSKKIDFITTEDEMGVVIRYMKSPAPEDEWHYEKGFVNSVKGAECYIYNFDTGLDNMFNVNLYY